MRTLRSKSELQLFKQMLYAFSFTTLSCMICGAEVMSGVMSTTFNVIIVLLGELVMLGWIFQSFPNAKMSRNRITFNSVARICGAIGLIFALFAMLVGSNCFQKFIFLASLPYLLVSGVSWLLLYLYRNN